MKKLFLLLVVLLAGFSAWAQEGSWNDYRNTDWGSDYENSTEFTITDAADFAQFAFLVNNGRNFEDKTISLAADIDLSAHYWVPVGSTDNSFSGTFDGSAKTISNLFVSVNDGYIGLFGYVELGTVKNLSVASGYVEGSMSVGTIVGGLYKGSVTDCHVGDVTVRPHQDESSPNYFGGIVGAVNMGTVSGCHSQATVAGIGWSYGGIVGNKQSGTLTGCTSAASITDASGTGENFGGIVGWNYSGPVLNCLYSGETLGGENYVGAVAGRNNATITNCYHTLEGIGGIGGNDVDDQAMRGYTVKGSRDVVVALDENSLVGLTYDNIYAGIGQEIILRLSLNQGDAQNAPTLRAEGSPRFVADSGTLTDNGNGTWTLIMPTTGENVTISVDNGTLTGIEEVNVATAKSGRRYNLMGQPVSNDYKGIVIENNKKVIVK